MKNNNCFNCVNHSKGIHAENTGWYHKCKFGIENEGMNDISKCEKYYPNEGFQIGGYYSHIHFKKSSEHIDDSCLEMIIHSDGEFPTENEKEQIIFHICNFKQIETFVEFWGKYLREKGLINE